MPDFTARICRDYRDVSGLILDCRHDGLAVDGSVWENTAPASRALARGSHVGLTSPTTLVDSSKYWRANQHVGKMALNLTDGSSGQVVSSTINSVHAPLSGGVTDTWQLGDSYVLTSFRPGNAYQAEPARRPIPTPVGGLMSARFQRSNSHFMNLDVAYPFYDRYFTTMMDMYTVFSDVSQCVIGFPNYKFYARNGSGNFEYQYNGTPQAGSVGMSSGVWLFSAGSASVARVWEDGAQLLNGTFAPMDVDAGEPAGYIGSADGVSDYLNAYLHHIALWDRLLSPLERDFAFASFHLSASHSAWDRPVVTSEDWTDVTDDDKASRVNPNPERALKYILATGPSGCRLQLAMSVDGYVRPDDELDSRLFTVWAVEHPSWTPPVFHSESGWSSVVDVELSGTGHYTFVVLRESGGRHILHVDVEVTA